MLESPNIRFYVGAPLVTSDGAALGTLCVFDSHPREMTPFQLDALRGLSRQVASLLELRRVARALGHYLRERDWYEQQLLQYQQLLEMHNADLAELSRTDVLTGLPNRRAFDAALAGTLAAAPSRRGLAVALVDIDHFKSINDLHGHPAGDEVIAAVAAAMRASTGPGAVVARYGGEEFAVLLADVDDSAAELQAEYLREAVQNLPIGIPVTVSVGVALRRTAEPVPALVERADRALYEAKRGGRNRVVLAGA